MFEGVPVQVWLLLAIGAAAYTRVVRLYETVAGASDPDGSASWLTKFRRSVFATSGRDLAILGGLAALAAFVVTPAAERFARSPALWPVLTIVGGVWALVAVVAGLRSGTVQPIVGSLHERYSRRGQPKRFWASVAWNTLIGCLLLWLPIETVDEVPGRAMEDRCFATDRALAPQDSLTACEQLIAMRGTRDRETARLIEARGSANYLLGDYRRATADYMEAIRIDPTSSSRHYNLGLVDTQVGDLGLAVDEFGAAIQLDPDNVDAHMRRGLIFLDRGRFDEAEADFSKVLTFRPTDPDLLARRGLTFAWRGEEGPAMRDFAKVRGIYPSNIIMLRGLALLRIHKKDWKGAVALLTQAIDQNPADDFSLFHRAEMYRKLGDESRRQADLGELSRLNRIRPDRPRRPAGPT